MLKRKLKCTGMFGVWGWVVGLIVWGWLVFFLPTTGLYLGRHPAGTVRGCREGRPGGGAEWAARPRRAQPLRRGAGRGASPAATPALNCTLLLPPSVNIFSSGLPLLRKLCCGVIAGERRGGGGGISLRIGFTKRVGRGGGGGGEYLS